MATNFTIFLLCLNLFSTLFISTSSLNPITLELSPIRKRISSQSPEEFISHVVKSTLQRAFHLKHLNKNTSSPPINTSTPLFPVSADAEYSINLSLGTPPQKIPALFDTGSSLVWVPCTSNYTCTNCFNNTNIITFIPNHSSSKNPVNCNNKRCSWLDQPTVMSSCLTCVRIFPGSCSRPCTYIERYGGGDTTGNAIFENLNFENKIIPDFFVGCSSVTDIIPEGIAGFGRSPMSLPKQLGLNKFSYCLISHDFDDTLKSSSLILGDSIISGLKYTPLLKNPPMFPFNQYYYVQLEEITVGGKIVKLPEDVNGPDGNGDGGTVMDSGTTLTTLGPNLFSPVTKEFKEQLTRGQQNKIKMVQFSAGNVMCMNVKGQRNPTFPDVVFQFKGGVKLDLTVDNYIYADENLACLPFANVSFAVGVSGNGPAIILGNYQQQNFHIEYDLQNERLGIKKNHCG